MCSKDFRLYDHKHITVDDRCVTIIQWNPSIVNTIGNQHFSEVSLTPGLPE